MEMLRELVVSVSSSTCSLMNAVATVPCSVHCVLIAESSSLYVRMSRSFSFTRVLNISKQSFQ